MNPKNLIPKTTDPLDSKSQWLIELINQTASQRAAEFAEFCRQDAPPISPEKRQRCLAAADEAMALAKLQLEQIRIGFRPLSLSGYLQQLAQSAGVSLAAISARFGAADSIQPTAVLASLAREIGLSLHQTWLHFRISLAELAGHELMLAPSRRGTIGSPSNGIEKQCEQILSDIENDYNDCQRQEYLRMKAEIDSVFSENAE